MQNLPGGIEPMTPAWAGGFLTTGPPGKSQNIFIKCVLFFSGFFKMNTFSEKLL